MVLAHLAAGIGDELVAVVQRHAKARIRQDFGHATLHFNQFFFGHVCGQSLDNNYVWRRLEKADASTNPRAASALEGLEARCNAGR